MIRHTFFATCAPGVESLLYAEVRALGLNRPEQQVGGVRFEGTLEDCWKAGTQGLLDGGPDAPHPQ